MTPNFKVHLVHEVRGPPKPCRAVGSEPFGRRGGSRGDPAQPQGLGAFRVEGVCGFESLGVLWSLGRFGCWVFFSFFRELHGVRTGML